MPFDFDVNWALCHLHILTVHVIFLLYPVFDLIPTKKTVLDIFYEIWTTKGQ